MPRSFREKEQGDLGIQKAGWLRAWRAREEARRADSGSAVWRLESGGWRAEAGERPASRAARGRPPGLGTRLPEGGPGRAGLSSRGSRGMRPLARPLSTFRRRRRNVNRVFTARPGRTSSVPPVRERRAAAGAAPLSPRRASGWRSAPRTGRPARPRGQGPGRGTLRPGAG